MTEETDHGAKRVCTICLNDNTPNCMGCTWFFGLTPTNFKKDPKKKWPKGDLEEVVQ